MSKVKAKNIFLNMHPFHRILISVLLSVFVYFFTKRNFSTLIATMLLWDIFSLSYLILNWIVLAKRPIPEIRNWAKRDDGSIAFVSILILISSVASMFTVLLLMVSQSTASAKDNLYLPVAIAGVLFSWLMVHTIYTFHYAHMYYDDDEKNPQKDAHGLEFPGEDTKPDYVDFAYFSFVIGCTFQVSDVEISSAKIRKVVLFHGLLSFALNTFVVALTINLIAGLSK
ncbi:MAG: DUF1345 domain-containing protein [Parafilimonas sp.]